MSFPGAALPLVRLFADHRLSVVHLRDALWAQGVWPWTPPTTPPGWSLAETLGEYVPALDVHLIVVLERLEAAVTDAEAALATCRRDPGSGLCVRCAGWVDQLDLAVASAAREIAVDVPTRAAAGLAGAVAA